MAMTALRSDERGSELVKSDLVAEVVERRDAPGCWGVEAIDAAGDGQIYMALFSGPDARDLAIEYAMAKHAECRVS